MGYLSVIIASLIISIPVFIILLAYDRKADVFLLFRFVAKNCVSTLVFSIVALFIIQQFTELPSGNEGGIVLYWFATSIIIWVGEIIGYIRYKIYRKALETKAPPKEPTLPGELWEGLTVFYWAFILTYVCLGAIAASFHVNDFLEIFQVSILIALGIAYWEKRSIFKAKIHTKYVSAILLSVFLLFVLGFYFIRDSLPAVANSGSWKKYYSAEQVSDWRIKRELNRLYRTQQSQEMDKFWAKNGVKGLPYVVKLSQDLRSQRRYKDGFAKAMLQHINDPIFIPELRKLMFGDILSGVARDRLFALNAPFTKEELLKLSSMPEYFSLKSINPAFEKAINKLPPDDLVDFYLPNTLTYEKLHQDKDQLVYKSTQEEILGYIKKVLEINSNKGFKLLIGQYCALLYRREEAFADSQSSKMKDFYSSTGRERVLEAVKYCDELIPPYKDLIYSAIRTHGIGLIPESARDYTPPNGKHAIKFKLLSTKNILFVTVTGSERQPLLDLQNSLWDRKKVLLTDRDGELFTKNISFDFKCIYGNPPVNVTINDNTQDITFSFSAGSPSSLH